MPADVLGTRYPVSYYMAAPVLTSQTETLANLTGTKGDATVTPATSPAVVTAGRSVRLTSIALSYIATATSGYAIFRLRYNPTGLVALGSPVLHTFAIGAGTPAAANSVTPFEATFPEGIELPAGTGYGITVQGFAAATATAVGYAYASLLGFEHA